MGVIWVVSASLFAYLVVCGLVVCGWRWRYQHARRVFGSLRESEMVAGGVFCVGDHWWRACRQVG